MSETAIDTDELALLKAICREPQEDTPRLVFADFLDERNDDARKDAIRAAFIRAQIEMARMPEYIHLSPFASPHKYTQWAKGRTTSPEYEHLGELVQRLGEELKDDHLSYGSEEGPTEWSFKRGFPCAVRCHWETWLEMAPRVAYSYEYAPDAEYPVTILPIQIVRVMGRLSVLDNGTARNSASVRFSPIDIQLARPVQVRGRGNGRNTHLYSKLTYDKLRVGDLVSATSDYHTVERCESADPNLIYGVVESISD